jgi:hydroxyacylglutathione hydrolase
MNCNIYAIVGSRETALIDTGCGFDVPALLESIRSHGLELPQITLALLTHTHWDHARGAAAVKRATGCRIAVHRAGRETLEHGPWLELGTGRPSPVSFAPVEVSEVFDDNDEIDLGGRVLRVLHTPGHSDDSVCFELELEEGTRILFSGDTVSAAGKPGITTAENDFRVYRDSVERLAERPIDALLPGHGIFVLEAAYEHVRYLVERLNSKWVDPAAVPYPAPFDSGAWYFRNNPELLAE